MNPAADYTREADHARFDAQLRAYLERGGQIEQLPAGQCNWDSLTNRQKINPNVRPEDKSAKSAAAKALPVPKGPTAPKVRPPVEGKKRERNGPVFAPEGGQKARILALLAVGPMTPQSLANAIGTSRNVINGQLYGLRDHEMVESFGPGRAKQWRLCA